MSFRIKLITTWTLWSHYHYVQVLVSQFCWALCDSCSPPGSSVQGHSPGKNIGVGCHARLQGIFPTQESNPGLLSCRQILYCLSHQGSPWRRLEACFKRRLKALWEQDQRNSDSRARVLETPRKFLHSPVAFTNTVWILVKRVGRQG